MSSIALNAIFLSKTNLSRQIGGHSRCSSHLKNWILATTVPGKYLAEPEQKNVNISNLQISKIKRLSLESFMD
jgi:hypothetical protein